jgi:acyl-coenzyme A thioesterase PaaI-like protein
MPSAATLGLEILAVDEDHGIIELAFTAPDTYTNPAGNVLGASVAAVLYDTVGLALLATVEPGPVPVDAALGRDLPPSRTARAPGGPGTRPAPTR